ncbi:MAG: hypothetical protein VB858_19360 [Planctomycetaceae bacterium]
MKKDRRIVWILAGMMAGIGLASIWPHEELSAATSDRNEKFAVVTAHLGLSAEGVFVLDFLTGRLTGACLNRTRNGTAFVHYYFRNAAEDFQVAGSATPYYAITSGAAEIQNRGGAQWGQSAIYIAELNSGQVQAYAVPYRITQVPQAPVPLIPVAAFPFRERTVTE